VTSCSRQSQLRHVAKCMRQNTSIGSIRNRLMVGRVRVRVCVLFTVTPVALYTLGTERLCTQSLRMVMVIGYG